MADDFVFHRPIIVLEIEKIKFFFISEIVTVIVQIANN